MTSARGFGAVAAAVVCALAAVAGAQYQGQVDVNAIVVPVESDLYKITDLFTEGHNL